MNKEIFMKIVMFDLDGTLLPMDQDVFVKAYFSELCKKAAPFGYDPEKLIKGVWAGTGAMVKNNGAKTNEAAERKPLAFKRFIGCETSQQL